jgi:molybdate transport system ATP-binding protein
VFQDYALFPHLTVRRQIALALGKRPSRGPPGRVEELLSLTRLEGLADRKPASLSGGQQQRVALARALARDPAVLLLDEPFAAVDLDLRDALRHELRSLQRQLSLTVIIVTHDFQDVARLASRIVVLERGTMTAASSVEEITATNALSGRGDHWEPTVALDATVTSHDEARQLTHLGVRELRVAVPTIEAPPGAVVRVQIPAREVILAARRPEGLSLHNVLEARVLLVESTSHAALRLVHLVVGSTRLLSLVTVAAVRNLSLEPGAPVYALVKAVAVAAFT